MFRNVDGKTLADVSGEMGPDFAHLGYQRGSAFVDLNNDGFMDLVVTSLNEKPRILMNNALIKNHWLMLDLEGTKSNRDAIGAAIELVTASGRKFYNHLTTSIGFRNGVEGRERKVNFARRTEYLIIQRHVVFGAWVKNDQDGLNPRSQNRDLGHPRC